MNHYKHALMKEIAAQKAGFEPSHVWGRITNAHENQTRESRERYHAVMNSQHSTHMIESEELTGIKGVADNFIQNLPKDGVIKAESFNKNLT